MSRQIISRAGLGFAAQIEQYGEMEMLRVCIDQPSLLMVRSGCKVLRWQQREQIIEAGQAVVFAPGLVFDVTNRRGGTDGYRATSLGWDNAMISAAAALLHSDEPRRPVQTVQTLQPLGAISADFYASYLHAVAGLANPSVPQPVARQRMLEMLWWLADAGVQFSPDTRSSLGQRLRQLLVSDPGRPWSAAEVARHFATSEATLRRRLAQEQLTLSSLLHEVRMASALTLLQCTSQSVTQIAQTVGYDSASRFAIRFRQRYGFAPTGIRGHQREAA
ncbi:helix-turn-helix transcriptional regulator [Amantichitinum ursilacus]|uniref:Urease operon transcriptional activator n=1 Tax=Amantichitinum ursilacus TaxID=857265 RepID=A0A0N1JTD0_9NEIS|nr:helix-turn-helix transcriptional regulator [Amantichitinum ursilacus]KPC54311.1 Urease operon transcriptional activator [Amantichitinum ursilacus]